MVFLSALAGFRGMQTVDFSRCIRCGSPAVNRSNILFPLAHQIGRESEGSHVHAGTAAIKARIS
jgi:hypothetical protein